MHKGRKENRKNKKMQEGMKEEGKNEGMKEGMKNERKDGKKKGRTKGRKKMHGKNEGDISTFQLNQRPYLFDNPMLLQADTGSQAKTVALNLTLLYVDEYVICPQSPMHDMYLKTTLKQLIKHMITIILTCFCWKQFFRSRQHRRNKQRVSL